MNNFLHFSQSKEFVIQYKRDVDDVWYDWAGSPNQVSVKEGKQTLKKIKRIFDKTIKFRLVIREVTRRDRLA